MSYYALRKMDEGTYIRRLVDAAMDVLDNPTGDMFFAYESKGHTDLHYAKEPEELIRHMLEDNTAGSTCFFSEAAGKESVADTVAYLADQIAEWFYMSPPMDEDRKEEFETFSCSVNLGGTEPIGYGIDKMRELPTTCLR